MTDRLEDANHAPEVRIAEGLDLVATPGQELTLHAMADDPDSDAVALSWFRYADADGCAVDVALVCDGGTCTMRVPVDARPTDTIHIICRATDEDACAGEYMVGYARVIVTVA